MAILQPDLYSVWERLTEEQRGTGPKLHRPLRAKFLGDRGVVGRTWVKQFVGGSPMTANLL